MGVWRATPLAQEVLPYLEKDKPILDIGCGPGNVCKELTARGFCVTPLDVKNLSFVEGVTPLIYDGKTIPFPGGAFRTSLLITVLHHTHNPVALVKEAKRVSKEIVIIEEIYKNPIQKYLTFAMDSLTNLDLINLPHTNKTDNEWKRIFNDLGLDLVSVHTRKMCKIFLSTTYYLKRRN